MRKLILLIAAILPALSSALLPPLYETLAEFKSLINDDRLPKALQSGDVITDIRREDDQFVVYTNKNILIVKIVMEPQQMIGPAKFHLEFGQAIPH